MNIISNFYKVIPNSNYLNIFYNISEITLLFNNGHDYLIVNILNFSYNSKYFVIFRIIIIDIFIKFNHTVIIIINFNILYKEFLYLILDK